MDCLPLFKWFQPILNPEFSLIFGQIRIRFQIQKENGRIHAFLIGPKTFGIQNLELVKQCGEQIGNMIYFQFQLFLMAIQWHQIICR